MMPRHSNGHAYGPSNTFSISPHRCDTHSSIETPTTARPSTRDGRADNNNLYRFQPRSRTALLRWRRQLVIRTAAVVVIAIIFLFFFFPSLATAIAGSLTFGFLRGAPLSTVRIYDLADVQGTARGWEHEERILFCVPLRDAEAHLPMFFSHMRNFTYPHHLIDIAFLVSDSKDQTLPKLKEYLQALQDDPDDRMPYGDISLIEKDFGQKVGQDVENRHGFAAQASRRKTMAQARNWLLSAALRPHHSWVYWRDADVETAPATILEDLMRHNKDVIVPSAFPPHILRVWSVINVLSGPQTSGARSQTGSAASNPTTSTRGKNPKPP